MWVDLTETTDRIDPVGYLAAVLNRWGITNTSYVLDLRSTSPVHRGACEPKNTARRSPGTPQGRCSQEPTRPLGVSPSHATVTGGHRGNDDRR